MLGDLGPGLISWDDARKGSIDLINAETTRATTAEAALAARPYPKYAKKLATNASGVLTVTFPAGLFSAPPVISLDIEAAAGSVYSASVEGAVSATGFTARVYKSSTTLSIIALGTITLFSNPGVVTINVMAMDATT